MISAWAVIARPNAICRCCGHTLVLDPGETIPLLCPACGADRETGELLGVLRGLAAPADVYVEAHREGYALLICPLPTAPAIRLTQGATLAEALADTRWRASLLLPLTELAACAHWQALPYEPELLTWLRWAWATNHQIEIEGGRWRVRPVDLPLHVPHEGTHAA